MLNKFWNLILVNPWNKLPDDFEVSLIFLDQTQAVDKRIWFDLRNMLEAAYAEGLRPVICSSYRTKEKQQTLFENKVAAFLMQGYSTERAGEEAGKWVAPPGTSEHQTGLSLDIVSAEYPYLEQEQENTPEQKWLMKHCWQYGFILRYPRDKTKVTGIHYEPWHYRYVGKKAAKEIQEKGLCLEEYLSRIS